jgi:antitoxin VapB
LNPEEGERFRQLGRMCAEAMDTACRAVQPGMTEYEIAAILGAESQKRGAQPIVNLIATDERIHTFRHPLPTAKKLDKYAMLILCGRWMGLVASITRLVHFGRMPDELIRREAACARVDATVLNATRPGRSVAEVFATLQTAYADEGFDGEWKLHHQGGPAAYEPREYIATPASTDQVYAGQAYAWNPSITGVKFEDTILVSDDGFEVITEIPGWPVHDVGLSGGVSIKRPAIFVIN